MRKLLTHLEIQHILVTSLRPRKEGRGHWNEKLYWYPKFKNYDLLLLAQKLVVLVMNFMWLV